MMDLAQRLRKEQWCAGRWWRRRWQWGPPRSGEGASPLVRWGLPTSPLHSGLGERGTRAVSAPVSDQLPSTVFSTPLPLPASPRLALQIVLTLGYALPPCSPDPCRVRLVKSERPGCLNGRWLQVELEAIEGTTDLSATLAPASPSGWPHLPPGSACTGAGAPDEAMGQDKRGRSGLLLLPAPVQWEARPAGVYPGVLALHSPQCTPGLPCSPREAPCGAPPPTTPRRAGGSRGCRPLPKALSRPGLWLAEKEKVPGVHRGRRQGQGELRGRGPGGQEGSAR